jgi:hypothetical protein
MAKKGEVSTQTETREKIAVWLDHDVLKQLREYQSAVGVPVSVSIRKAIDDYLSQLKIPKK